VYRYHPVSGLRARMVKRPGVLPPVKRGAPVAHVLAPLVRKLECEAGLSPEERKAVLSLPVIIRQMRAEHDIFCERDRPSQCCLVLDGWLNRHKILQDGTRQILSFHIAGDIPDLQSLHLIKMDHSLSTLVPSKVAFIQHETIKMLISDFPRLGHVLWRDTLIDAAIFREWMVGMGRRDAPARIAHLFCELFTRMRAVGLTTGYSCNFPVTQSALADALGLSTVHVNRSIMDLRGQELIRLEKPTLTILNWEALTKCAEFDPLYLHMKTSAEAAG
jgi:CRP-like cAMP-binding protein